MYNQNIFTKNPYFNASEFASPDYPLSGNLMDNVFVGKLTSAREISKVSYRINSGYRTVMHNDRVNGAKNSDHLNGLAVDISAVGNNKRYHILKGLFAIGFTTIIVYPTHIHVADKYGSDHPTFSVQQ